MSRCKACGRPARKTSIARVSTAEGWVTGRVCSSCKGRGLLVVAQAITTPAPRVTVVDGADAIRTMRSRFEVFRRSCELQIRKLPTPHAVAETSDREEYRRLEGQIESIDQAIALCAAALEGRL